MRLRRKLTLAFFLVSALVSLVLALVLYRFIDRALTGELRARLRDVAYLGAHLVDRPAYARGHVRRSHQAPAEPPCDSDSAAELDRS